jgi:hypothetical protein
LTNYEILIDDGLGGGFETIAGGLLGTYLQTSLIISKNSNDYGVLSFNV